MKKLLLFTFLICSAAAMAQSSFSGKVVNDAAQPIPFATVQLLKTDSSLITGAITDEQGEFTLSAPAGKAILQISYIGFTSRTLDLLLPLQESLGQIILKEETEQIKEVEVKAKKQLIERKMDKLVLNVSASPLAAGSNGIDLIKKAPGVMVDKDGNVTVNGKGVEVYIDGRPSYLSGQQLKAMLEGTDGNTIEKIEIITNPSAKYDASGTGGIINIKTKKNMMQGLNGTLSAAYGGMYFKEIEQWLQQDYVSLNMNYRTQKTYTNLSFTQVYADMNVGVDAITSTPEQTRWTKNDYAVGFQHYMLKLAQDFMIDDKNTLGFIFQAPVLKINQDCNPSDYTGYVVNVAGDTTERDMSPTMMDQYAPQHTVNLNYTHVFSDSLERELTVNADYNRYNTRTINNQDSRYLYLRPGMPDSTTWKGMEILTKQIVNIYSAKADFQTMFWKTGMLETGVKYALSNTTNNMTTDSLLNGVVISQTPSDFDYSEHVAAAYITAGKQFGQHFAVKLGLRGEYTYSFGNWITSDSITKKSYFDVFPTAFFSYTSSPLGKPGQPISTSISYTRRIKRPSYYQLNPFRTYIDAHNYQMGNTELTPEFNNDVELTFAYSQYLSLTFNFSHTQDMMMNKSYIMPNGDGVMQCLNFGTCTTHGGNLSLTELPIVPKFDADHNLQGAWLALTINAGYYNFINRAYKEIDNYVNRSHYYSMSGTLNAYLPKDWVISVDGWYSAPMTIGYNYQDAQFFANAGIRKMFPKIGLILNLQLHDMLRTSAYNQRSEGLGEGYAALFNQDMRQQKLMLSVTYMFGNQQWYKRRKVGNRDEDSRLGGGGGAAKM